MRLFRWGNTIPEFSFWHEYFCIHQWMIRSEIPLNKSDWQQHEFLRLYCMQWSYDELNNILKGTFPDLIKITEITHLIINNQYVFCDLEQWVTNPNDNEQVKKLKRLSWIYTVTKIKMLQPFCRLGVYLTPIPESNLGVTQSKLAKNVHPKTVQSRIDRWIDTFNKLFLEGFFEHIDLLCPDLYVRYFNPRIWLVSCKDTLEECSRLYEVSSKEIIPFISCKMFGKTELLPHSYWLAVCDWLKNNVSSSVIYEPSNSIIDMWYYTKLQQILISE